MANYNELDVASTICDRLRVIGRIGASAATITLFSFLAFAQVPAEEVQRVRSEAEAGDADAQVALGNLYRFGNGVPQDAAEAIAWYTRAAAQGNLNGQLSLAGIYMSNVGHADQSVALRARQRSEALLRGPAEQGHPEAEALLGALLFLDGRTEPVLKEAADWLRRAAEKGHATAQYNLAGMYEGGIGIPEDADQAEQWLRRAAEQDHAASQYHLGLMHLEGRGVQEDFAQAEQWWRRAAEQGMPLAQFSLGMMYSNGRVVGRDLAQAVQWWRRAAEQGMPEAQYRLAEMYDFGYGVRKDADQAEQWLRRAAEQDFQPAQDALRCVNLSEFFRPEHGWLLLELKGEEEVGNDSFLGWTSVNHHYNPMQFLVGRPEDLLDDVFCHERGGVYYKSEAIEAALRSDKSVYIENERERSPDYFGGIDITRAVYSRDVIVTVPANCRLGSSYHNCDYVIKSQQVRRSRSENWRVSSYRGLVYEFNDPLVFFLNNIADGFGGIRQR